jgi:hypothetical protein
MSEWFSLIDKRTGKEKKVREFEGVQYAAMQASITNIDKFGVTTISFGQAMKLQDAMSISSQVLDI